MLKHIHVGLSVLLVISTLYGCSTSVERYCYSDFPHGHQDITIYEDRLYYFSMDWGMLGDYSYGTIQERGDTLLLIPATVKKFYMHKLDLRLEDSTKFTFQTNKSTGVIPMRVEMVKNGKVIKEFHPKWETPYTLDVNGIDSLVFSTIDHLEIIPLTSPENKCYHVFYNDYNGDLFFSSDTIQLFKRGKDLVRIWNGFESNEVFTKPRKGHPPQ